MTSNKSIKVYQKSNKNLKKYNIAGIIGLSLSIVGYILLILAYLNADNIRATISIYDIACFCIGILGIIFSLYGILRMKIYKNKFKVVTIIGLIFSIIVCCGLFYILSIRRIDTAKGNDYDFKGTMDWYSADSYYGN